MTASSRPRHRGIALVLVIIVMALAAILGYALLSASAIQATASSNSIAAAIARAQAESGIHMAMYYLFNSTSAPALVSNKWSNVTFGTLPGSVTVTVIPVTGISNEYTVTSAGSSDSSVGVQPITRTITAVVKVVMSFQIPQAAGFNGSVSIGALGNITGSPAISSSGTVTIASGAQVTGNVSAASFAGSGAPTGQELSAPTTPPAPAQATDVYDYTQPYTYNGTQYTPQAITSPMSGTWSPNPLTNPLGIFYCTGSLTVSSTLNITGTLIVNGQLTDSSAITITPVTVTPQPTTNMPALVVSTAIKMNGSGKTLTATGVVYAGTGITGTSTTSSTSISINGALLISAAINPITTYTGKLIVTYNNAYTKMPSFSSSNQTPTGVKIISWSE